MSKAVKEMLIRDYKARIEGVEDAALINIRGVKAINTNRIRRGLAAKNIRITVVRNSLARKAIEGTGLAPLGDLLEGANALAYGGNSVVEVAREIVDLLKEHPTIELKGAVLDGTLFSGDEGVKELSRFPTREEAIGRAITLILAPAQKLVGQMTGPGASLAGIIKAIEERLEKGEAITRVAG